MKKLYMHNNVYNFFQLKRWRKAGILGLFDGSNVIFLKTSIIILTSWTDGA